MRLGPSSARAANDFIDGDAVGDPTKPPLQTLYGGLGIDTAVSYGLRAQYKIEPPMSLMNSGGASGMNVDADD
ncbi:hypothetical protein GFM14_36130 [Rhizobium leguminosarum bv. viciae]|nr:hypothetical protein [Rhizobium leguminosarum bv. viciae]GLR55525.1 hypothetical protein GCM10007919_02470 [Rhizobium indigoferae]